MSLYNVTSSMSKQFSNMAVIIIYCVSSVADDLLAGEIAPKPFCSLRVLSTFSVVILCCVSCQLLLAAARSPSRGWHMSTKCHSLVQCLPHWFSTVSPPAAASEVEPLWPQLHLRNVYTDGEEHSSRSPLGKLCKWGFCLTHHISVQDFSHCFTLKRWLLLSLIPLSLLLFHSALHS